MPKHFFIPVLSSCVFLAACSPRVETTNIEKEILNPLTASRFGDELADTMANLVIQNDPLAADQKIRAIIDREIMRGKKIGDEAREIIANGMQGGLIPVREDMSGYALYFNDVLYFSSEFYTKPGPALHVFLTTVVDPRDAAFPDPTALDLGLLQSPYGSQSYAVPNQDKPELYRTLVLWDTDLGRMYGFAQLSKR